jgi:hypothetical protein
MQVEWLLFSKGRETGKEEEGQDRVMGMNIIKVCYMHL